MARFFRRGKSEDNTKTLSNFGCHYLVICRVLWREEHFETPGFELGYTSANDYDQAAAAVVSDSRALHKLEKEDGDDVYYLKDTNEFVIVSTDGYIRTYFYPRDGIEYFERQ